MKRKLLLFILFLCTLFVQQNLKAQATVLAPGDIAFIGYQAGTPTDGFSFITLKNINAGTLVYFTECGWGNGAWIPFNTETHLLWTVPAFTPAGTIVSIVETSADTFTISGSSGIALALNTGFNFTNAGDQILAYQSSTGPQPVSPTFIAGIHTDFNSSIYDSITTWNTTIGAAAGGASESSLPPGLTNGVTCISLFPAPGPEQANSKYIGTLTGTTTDLLAKINNPSALYWSHSSGAADLGITPANYPAPAVSTVIVPTVSTITATNIKAVSAIIGGNVTSDGGETTVQRGIVWATTAAPTITDHKVQNGTGIGNFSATITGLPSGTTIHYRAYATNSAGTSYGTESTFNTGAGLSTSSTSKVDILCNAGATGSATVVVTGGTLGYTYSWSPSGGTGATASNLTAGNYTVTITDGESTQITRNFNIIQPAALDGTSSTTAVTCFELNNGIAVINPTGGAGGYTYAWSPSGGTGAIASGLAAGNYSVTITDGNSCTKTITGITVGGPTAALTATTSTTPVSCFGGANGTATVTPAGGTGTKTYLWSNGATTATATGLTTGNYSVTVKDANLCSTTITGIFVGTPADALGGNISTTPVSCFGGSNGTATVTPSGGTGTKTFEWSTGAKTATVTGLIAGTYSVTITDQNGCSSIINDIFISQPAAALNGTSVVTNIACNGGSTGVASITPTGGTGPYTVKWNNGATTPIITGLLAGVYSVTITDANSCVKFIDNIMVTQPSALILTSAKTNVACNGGSNGVASVTATGGAGGYTYLWNTGAKTSAITGLTAGTYSVTVTDNNSCSKTINNINITQPDAIDGTTSTTSVSCFGGSNGSASVTAIGGAGGYSYSWSPTGGNDAIATGLTAGTYRVTITDANSCSKTINDILVGGPTAALKAAPAAQTNILCNGKATGSATVTATGGTGTYTYSWAPTGGTAATASGLTAGTYTATVTDANACSSSQSFTISEPATLVASPLAQTNIACNGGTTGSATVTATGGTGAYTYSWSPSGGTAATASGLAAGTYTVTVTDKNLCFTTQSFTITQPPVLSATTTSTGVSCFGGSNGTASVTVSGGTSNYSYSWAPLGGSTSFISGRPAGDYTCTITDANGCTLVKTVEIKSPAAFSATVTQTDVSCNGGSNGSATITPTGATFPYTYTWPSGGSNATASGLSAGDYTVLVQDANTCVYSVTVKIKQPAALTTSITKTDVLCNGGATGTATVVPLGGTKPYSYVWSSGGGNKETATGLKTGYYTCTITDARGCFVSASITVDEPAALSAATSKIDATCTTSGEASVSVNGGTTPYSYEWSSGQKSAIATGLAAGNYTCLITDANGCIITKNVLINTTNTLVAIANQTNILCNGANTGSAWVVPAGAPGPFTYVWAPYGGSSDTASNLTAGNYSVTITAANGCSIVKNFTLTEPSALVVIPSQTNLLCHGAATGSASVNVTGGTGSYTYKWAPTGGTDATATGLTAGTYTVTITDGNLCETTQSFTITEPNPIKITINSKNVSCNGESNGSATATVIGGTGAYTYAWSPSGGTAATASGLSPGNYTITVTDANNCSTTESILITEPNVLTASIGAQIDASCNGSNNGSATVAVSGGFGTYTYSWSPSGGTAATATGLSPGTYTATVTDANNCTAKQSFTIGEPTALKATSTQKNVTCYNADNGEATVTISGGTAPYSYKWSNSDSTTQTAQNLVKGDYVCTITDSNNCSVNQSFTITQPSSPIGLITSIPTEFTASSVTLNVNASQNGIDGDLGECTSEIGLVFATAANPKINDSKIVLGSNPGTFTKIIEGLLGNKVYYVRAYSIGKFGYVNYGNEISFTTQKNILKVVAASDQTKVYGSTEPKLTYVATGFVNGDSNSIITGLLSRTAGENAGTYPITLGTLSAGANYTIDFKTSDFKITKANQVIEWNQDLAFGCNTTDQVQLTASSNSGLPVSYVVENSSIAAIQGDVLKINRAGATTIKVSQEGDQNHNPAVQITKLIEVSQSGNISQYWEDTLLFDNSTKNYSSFQWYKNGVLIPGATSQYYSEKPLKGTYSVQAKDKDGNVIKFCPITIDTQTFSKALKLYPNPVRSLSELTIESDYSAEDLKDSRINIFDLSGKLVTTVNNVSPKVIVTAPSSTGIYVVVLSLANGQHKTINLLVR
ncbi:MBG domain-containing protein [Flavobacterium oncorhynchi]|uniref:MBG domain-containing protein n=1 Tax=Flavobacterium oncorhynchi TaxID=728056 RepID=UPI00351A00C2